MKRYAFLLLLPFVLVACQSQETAEMTPEQPYEVYGEEITDVGAVPVQAVAAEPASFTGQSVKVEGTVVEVCQQKGCWLTLRAGDDLLVRVVVPRTEAGDYVFTVPTDLSGRRVVVEGTLAEVMQSEHEQHHLAEDAGMDHEDESGEALAPKPELQLTARGVLVEKANT